MVPLKMELDARHLLCPMPVIRASAAVTQLASGDVLSVHCTDPGALYDIPAWCRLEGHEVLEAGTRPDGDVWVTFRVRK